MPEGDLAQDHREVEQREDDSCGELVSDALGEGSDVERDGEVGEALHERCEYL